MNVIIMVGKVIEVLSDKDNDLLSRNILIQVTRGYYDSQGQIINDLFKVKLWRGLSEIINENLSKSLNVMVKGRLELSEGQIIIVAENVEII
ncbi:MAG: single-stranded DNA-binding protein [Erysipelotrichaceae bacterium]